MPTRSRRRTTRSHASRQAAPPRRVVVKGLTRDHLVPTTEIEIFDALLPADLNAWLANSGDDSTTHLEEDE